jgi:hypothetical protein
MKPFIPLRIRPGLLFLCISLTASAMGWPASASTWIVNPGALTIHTAMASASSGDTLLLEDGTYFIPQAVRVKGGVTVTSRNGPKKTIIDAEGVQSSGFEMIQVSPPPTLNGLTVQHAVDITHVIGGAVFIDRSSAVITNCLLVANYSMNGDGEGGAGSAIAVVNGSATISNNTIVVNQSGGGAIALLGATTSALIERNILAFTFLSHSDTTTGWGIFCENSPSAIIDQNVFWANTPGDWSPGCSTMVFANNQVVDPMFCNPVTAGFPTDAADGDWRILNTSPLASQVYPERPGANLGLCGDTAAQPTSWGWLKGVYRR